MNGELLGTVKNTQGNPVASVTLLVMQGENSYGQRLTDADGHYQFASLPPNKYEVKVLVSGHVNQEDSNVVIHSGQMTILNFTLEKATAETEG